MEEIPAQVTQNTLIYENLFVTDRVKKKGSEYRILSNRNDTSRLFTKALQRVLFQKFREVIMGYKYMCALSIPHINKEYVDN